MPHTGTAHLSAHREPLPTCPEGWTGSVPPPARGGSSAQRSLTALLHVRAHEFLGVLLQDLVDLVEDRVDVVGQLLVPFLDLLGRAGLGLLGLLGAPARLPLASGVLRCHRLPPSGGVPSPTAFNRYPRPRRAGPIL